MFKPFFEKAVSLRLSKWLIPVFYWIFDPSCEYRIIFFTDSGMPCYNITA